MVNLIDRDHAMQELENALRASGGFHYYRNGVDGSKTVAHEDNILIIGDVENGAGVSSAGLVIVLGNVKDGAAIQGKRGVAVTGVVEGNPITTLLSQNLCAVFNKGFAFDDTTLRQAHDFVTTAPAPKNPAP